MKTKPSVSVIIPSFNCARYVAAAVDSVLAQTVAADEIIVIDDGSTDDTREVLAPYKDRVRYVYQSNSGISRTRNRGIQESTGSLIAFLDADDRWLPRKLEQQLACFEANPQVQLVHTDILHWNDTTDELKYIPQGRERFVGHCYREFFWHCRVLTSTVVLTRACLNDVGLFDPTIPGGYAEDLDLFLRISRKYPLGLVNEPLVHYRQHQTNATLNRKRMAGSAYFVFNRVLAHDREMWDRIGRKETRQYLQTLAFVAGYSHAEAGELKQARRYFQSALRHAPRSLYLWGLWGSTFLPRSTREYLRGAKARLRGRATVGRSS